VVTEQSDKSLLTPRIKIFFSTKSMAYVPPEVIDLGRPAMMEKIVAREDPQKWGIENLDQYWAA
jgi:hypothetical protein